MISIPIPSTAQHPGGLITALQAKGWVMIHKSEQIKQFPGQRPYKDLIREVQIVNYKFQKGNELMDCTINYDSQRDTYNEICRALQPR